jgi:thymidylate synthase
MESKADRYFRECLNEIKNHGSWDNNPRPKWGDGTPAFSKFITQKTFDYRIDKGELPLISMRNTAIRGGWCDIEAIYINQTNIIELMHPMIHSWWEPFVVSTNGGRRSIGQTYGHTVKRYNLIDNLLEGILFDPFGRRHIINLWQEQQRIEDPLALVPCAYETLYSIEEDTYGVMNVDMTLNQRSQDFIMTASINPMQYVMLGMAICGHLSFYSNKKYQLRNFKYNVQNLHVYDRHLFAIDELLMQPVQHGVPTIKLKENKYFYDYQFSDFLIEKNFNAIELSQKLELAV